MASSRNSRSVFPSTCSAGLPITASVVGFAKRMRPSRSFAKIASAELSLIVRSSAVLSRSACSARRYDETPSQMRPAKAGIAETWRSTSQGSPVSSTRTKRASAAPFAASGKTSRKRRPSIGTPGWSAA